MRFEVFASFGDFRNYEEARKPTTHGELALFPSNIASKLSQQILNHSKILPENVFKSAIIQDASILTGDLNALEIQYLVEKHVDSQSESSYSRFSTRILLHDF